MKFTDILSLLLFGSAISLTVGGAMLYTYSMVPVVLTEVTLAAVVVILILAYFVYKGRMVAINISTVLGIFAPLLSVSMPEHLAVVGQFGHDALITFLGLLQILGFYVFPIMFVILRLVFRRKLIQAKPQNLQDISTTNKP